MAMAMAKLFCLVMKMKRLVGSISVQKVHTQSISSTPTPIGLLKRCVAKEYRRPEVNLLSILKYPNTDFVVEDIDLPYFKDSTYYQIRGRTHGMVCLTERSKNIMVGNPATNEFRTLPPSILTDVGETRHHTSLGFGYDPKSKDFKVVRFLYFPDKKRMTSDYKVEVYNLTTGRWTEIIDPKIPRRASTPSFEIYHKGIYYWWNAIERCNETILTFDFTHEVFHTLPVPESCLRLKDDLYDLYVNDPSYVYGVDDLVSMMVWNGSIVMFHNTWWCGDEKCFDMWVMDYDETDGGGVSWSKVLTIGPVFGVERLLMFVNSDELVMEARDGNMISYNVITKEIKNLPMKGTPISSLFLYHCVLSTS